MVRASLRIRSNSLRACWTWCAIAATLRRKGSRPPYRSRISTCVRGRSRFRCSPCPWISTSRAASSLSSFRETVRPLMRQKLRPLRRTSRLRIRVSGASGSSKPSASNRRWTSSVSDGPLGALCGLSDAAGGVPASSWKTASTSARSAPARTISAVARSPNSSPMASIMIDLPAPVSPVRMFNPEWKRRCNRSMIAKSRI